MSPAYKRRRAPSRTKLRFVSESEAGITRRTWRGQFAYRFAGKDVRDKATLKRIKALVIPPAWRDVWICKDDLGHIQAVGRDARGRKQYRYHARWLSQRDHAKYDRLIEFAEHLPQIRQTISRHLSSEKLDQRKVLSAIVALLDKTHIRIGNSEYAQTNGSYGLTTLRDRHVLASGATLQFHFKGKSGKEWKLKYSDRRIAKVVKACQDLPGQHLFQYQTEGGKRRSITSQDVNRYIREIASDAVSAKDFRTWAGTVICFQALSEIAPAATPSESKRNVKVAISEVARRLGNTVAISRKCYVHPAVIKSYEDGTMSKKRVPLAKNAPRFSTIEGATLRLLKRQSKKSR